ncbi:hypothetical protein [Cellulomonas sp.]|uniref:hypothetical protein n=1 Tax=Cellulomonas sp. TaxID=40001 RepID=UPI00258EC04C|nr:hypothetical protein [Cellulomonas sp.]MCR6690410.1 hypothetical protein [Cellulomonas sp.]
MHLWDLRASSDLPVDGDPHVWADAVDEVVTVMQPRQEAMGRMAPLPAPVHLVATDTGHDWLLGRRPDAADAPGGAPGGTPAVTVRADARSLALLLWGRPTPDAVTLDGDEDALEHALAQRLTP